MAGAIEEGAKAAGGVVDALKSQPLTLALVIMNVTLLGFLYFYHSGINEERKREQELLYQNRREVGELLARCTIISPDR